MPAYFIATYDISDPDEYAKYNPGAMQTIMGTCMKHKGKPLVATGEADWEAGKRHTLVVIEFPSVEDANGWLNDPEYVPLKAIRVGATTNRIELVAPGFVMPS
jgi:uncharacterized protein (DUF1330 family)